MVWDSEFGNLDIHRVTVRGANPEGLGLSKVSNAPYRRSSGDLLLTDSLLIKPAGDSLKKKLNVDAY